MLAEVQDPVEMESTNDSSFLAADVPLTQMVSHLTWRPFLWQLGNHPGKRILEVGSREVAGPSTARSEFAKAEYIGFDFYPGDNVDVVGDAHKLSSYFEGQQFDIIYTAACFEHFAMPWLVATEMAKLLKIDGLVFVETHFSFASHERPWNFFQFSDMGLRVLFSRSLGFECIEAGMGNPMVGRFSSLADEYLRNQPIPGLYCHSHYLGRKVEEVRDFDWSRVNLNEVVEGTKYPSPRKPFWK